MWIVGAFITGLNVSAKLILGFWRKPLAISLALCLRMEPSGLYLTRNIHLQSIKFISDEKGTNSHAWFLWSAVYSSFIASTHLESKKVSWTELGSAELIKAWGEKTTRCLDLDLVIIGWIEEAGTVFEVDDRGKEDNWFVQLGVEPSAVIFWQDSTGKEPLGVGTPDCATRE